MKQTTVEWLEDQYIKHSSNLLEMRKAFEQAKAMEKEASQQTAVEWLYNHLFPTKLDASTEEEWNKIDAIFEQAKAMEKEQTLEFTENAVRKILDEEISTPFNLEQYYNQIHGK